MSIILVVDDSKTIATHVQSELKKLSIDSIWIQNGKFLETFLIENNYIDISMIFLDWNMPEMTGIEFLKSNDEKNLTQAPIVMMTTESEIKKIFEAYKYNAKDYLKKPFALNDLEKILNEHIKN